MERGKTPRMREVESGQQEMQEKIVRMRKMVTNLTKGKRITDGLNLQRKLASWKDGTDPFIMPNLNDPFE